MVQEEAMYKRGHAKFVHRSTEYRRPTNHHHTCSDGSDMLISQNRNRFFVFIVVLSCWYRAFTTAVPCPWPRP